MHDDCLPVAERFVSINGEGLRAGRLSAFVRFAGCNLACSYCDTAWANEPDCACDYLSVSELVRWIESIGLSCVTLTGGEPLVQPLLPALLQALVGRVQSRVQVVEIETNGACDLSSLDQLRRRLERKASLRTSECRVPRLSCTSECQAPHSSSASECQALHSLSASEAQSLQAETRSLQAEARNLQVQIAFTMDCKCPSSGMADRMCAGNFACLRAGDAVKFVVGNRADMEFAARTIEAQQLHERCAVFLSPVFGQLDPADIVDFMKEKHLDELRLQLQLHKLLWPTISKGV